jgi:DNA processing protein
MSSDRVITVESEEWPAQLNELPDPPERLYLRGNGDLKALSAQAVAVIGARAATSYGEFVATDLACALAEKGYTVISGGAYGIDAAAHRGVLAALAGTAPTVLVSAGGLDHPYPGGHAELWPRVAERGVLVSEYEPGTIPSRDRFMARNRIVAALSQHVVVVEASIRSGTMNTVRHAEKLGRPVMAIPGPVTSIQSSGCHHLIAEGRAALVTNSSDVIVHLESFAQYRKRGTQ